MLSQQEFEIWCINNQITEQAKKLIERIRNFPPERKVKSGTKNVQGKFPSRKMGQSIQFESHTVELPRIYQMEFDSNIIEYYDQPSKMKLSYIRNINGKDKKLSFLYTPDFFELREKSAGWVECKMEEELMRLNQKDPSRYYKDGKGIWHCPPGEAYAEQFNLSFTVFSSNDINQVFLRNTKFLKDYYEHDYKIDNATKHELLTVVEKKPGILLRSLLEKFKSDDVYKLISVSELFVDLRKYSLAEPQYTHVFIDVEQSNSYVHIESKSDWQSNMIAGIEVDVGNIINWDGKDWKIINHGDSLITLMSDKNMIDLTYDQFNSYIKSGKIKGLLNSKSTHPYVLEAFLKASPDQCKVANERFRIIEPILNGEKPENNSVSPRTIRNWTSMYRSCEQIYGNGYIGLIPRDHEKGNRTKKLSEETEELIEKCILNKFETFKQKKKYHVFADFLLECESSGIQPCSYKTFVKRINSRPKHEQTKKRQGEKVAYQFESYYLEYELTSIRHGDRPFEISHIDHTELDIELIDSKTKKCIGRPWLTIMTDGYSRRILGLYLTFDPPSYRSCMMVLRECVKKWSRLPEYIVVDGGKEFSSIYFETVLSAFGVGKKQRPASKPRTGSVIERLFGMTNTRFIYNLDGNTQITKNVRQMTQENNPKKLAIWTYEMFVDRLIQFAYEIYDKMEHPALGGQSPEEAYINGSLRTGERKFLMIPYDETFHILTLPTSSKGTAKVVPSKGFKINYIYYWNIEFKNPNIEGQQVPIRYDPYNIGIAYAYINNRWVKCNSEYPTTFRNITEKQVQIATEEIKKNYQNHTKNVSMNSKILHDFLDQCNSDEVLLQQSKDREVQNAFSVILEEGSTARIDNESKQKINSHAIADLLLDNGVRFGEF